MADGTIEIEAKVNEKGIAAGLQRIANKIQKFGNSPVLKSLSNIGAAVSGVQSAYSIVTNSIKAASAAIKDLQEAYKVQAQAETLLEQSAKNNPYLLSENVAALKNYAAEIQSFTTYGDEQLMPLMAQLASSGRTQEEIMNIMSASVNLAASGTMSLDSAVSTLNKTYNGSAGLLGQQIGELRTLTEEELKQGKAVDIIAKKYDGMAAEVAKTTGTSQQLANAMGDLKEELGAPFEKALGPVRTFFTNLVGGWASALAERRKYKEAEKLIGTDAAIATTYDPFIKRLEEDLADQSEILARQIQKVLKEVNRTLKTNYEESSEEFQEFLRDIETDAFTAEQKLYVTELQKYKEIYEDLEAMRKEQAEKRQEEQEAQNAALREQEKANAEALLKAEQDKRDKLREQYDETIRQKQEEINQRRINGEEITAEAEAQEMYNTAFNAYIKMMSDKAFEGNSGNFDHEVNARKDIGEWGKVAFGAEASEQLKDFETELNAAVEELNDIVKDQYTTLLEQLDAEYKAVIENEYLKKEEKIRIVKEYEQKRAQIEDAQRKAKLKQEEADKKALTANLESLTAGNQTYVDQYKAKIKDLEDALAKMEESGLFTTEEIEAKKTEIVEAETQARKELASNIASDVANYAGQAVQIMQDASNLMLETVKNQYTAEQNELEIKYRKGEISEEEYNKKIAESKKKEAKEEYKIKMWQWGASILQATANIAQGIAASLAQGAPVGIITGALVGAAGAVQIASIIASKPTPPSFSTGGIVGGSSYNGDNIAANLNSREMVMNMSQQKGLWDFINGGSQGAGGGTNIIVENSASNMVQAKPEVDPDKITIAIDARVKDSLQKDRYGRELTMAEQNAGGDYLGI